MEIDPLIKFLNVKSRFKIWRKKNASESDYQMFYVLLFNRIADELLNNTILTIGTHKFRISEIEYYYQDKHHPDWFAHCDQMQKTNCKWYLHRTGNSYRNGTYKGIDITFGSKNSFGGILIRSMENSETNEIFEGPCVCVDQMIKLLNKENINDFASELEKSDFCIFNSPLSIVRIKKNLDNLNKCKIYRSSRVGLTLKKSSGNWKHAHDMHSLNQKDWIFRPYRYMTSLNKSKGKHYIIVELVAEGLNVDKIASKTGSTIKKVSSLIESYNKGSELNNIKSYENRNLTNEDICELYAILNK